METRKVVAILIAGLNEIVSNLEELIAEEGGKGPKEDDKPARASRAGRGKDKDKDEDEDAEEDDEDGDNDEPTEDEIVKATRAALKVLEKEDVVKIIKKHGKSEKASEVKPALRKAVIDALEKAVDDAE